MKSKAASLRLALQMKSKAASLRLALQMKSKAASLKAGATNEEILKWPDLWHA